MKSTISKYAACVALFVLGIGATVLCLLYGVTAIALVVLGFQVALPPMLVAKTLVWCALAGAAAWFEFWCLYQLVDDLP